MAAPEKNNFYKMRKKDGRELIFSSPDDLLDKAYDYFNWCNENPWIKKDFVKGGDMAGTIVDIPTSRPYTIEGLCVHIGICVQTFHNYEDRKDFFDVVTHIREVIRQNQIEGACVGAYNSNIVSRILGLSDKQEIESKGDIVINVQSDKTKDSINKLKKSLS